MTGQTKYNVDSNKQSKNAYGELVVVASNLPKTGYKVVKNKDTYAKSLMNYNTIREQIDHGMRMRVKPHEPISKHQKFNVA